MNNNIRLKSYAKEWIFSDSAGELRIPFDVLSYVRSKITGKITKELQVKSTDQRHWTLDCESTRPHTHLFIRWEE